MATAVTLCLAFHVFMAVLLLSFLIIQLMEGRGNNDLAARLEAELPPRIFISEQSRHCNITVTAPSEWEQVLSMIVFNLNGLPTLLRLFMHFLAITGILYSLSEFVVGAFIVASFDLLFSGISTVTSFLLVNSRESFTEECGREILIRMSTFSVILAGVFLLWLALVHFSTDLFIAHIAIDRRNFSLQAGSTDDLESLLMIIRNERLRRKYRVSNSNSSTFDYYYATPKKSLSRSKRLSMSHDNSTRSTQLSASGQAPQLY